VIRNLRTPGKALEGCSSFAAEEQTFQVQLGLHCFALLSWSPFAGTKATGLAAFLSREYCDSPAKIILLGQSKGGFLPPLAEQSR